MDVDNFKRSRRAGRQHRGQLFRDRQTARRHFAEDWSQIVHEVRGKILKAIAGRMYASSVRGASERSGALLLLVPGVVLRLSASDTHRLREPGGATAP